MQAIWDERPDIRRAIAPAISIVHAGADDRLTEAAKPLVEETWFEAGGRVRMTRVARQPRDRRQDAAFCATLPGANGTCPKACHEEPYAPRGRSHDPKRLRI